MKHLFIVPKTSSIPKRWPTTIQLSTEERLQAHRLQIKRMVEGKRKPTMTEIVSEALAILFKREHIEEETPNLEVKK